MVLRMARRVGLFESPAVQERTCVQSARYSITSFLLLGQISATIAEEDLKRPVTGDLRRHP